MHRIDGEGALPNGGWSEGDPAASELGTVVTADFMFAVQEEIANAVEGSGQVLDKSDNTQLLKAIGSGAGFRNRLINPHFRYWQRHAGPSPSLQVLSGGSGFFADRWFANGGSGASEVVDYSRVTPAAATSFSFTGAPAPPPSYLKVERSVVDTVAGGTYRTRLEDVRWGAGQDVTLSFWGYLDSGATTITPQLTQHFGSGGSPSADVVVAAAGGATAVLTVGAWKLFSFRFEMPNLSGKVLGSNGDDYVELEIDDGNTLCVYRILMPQLERATVASQPEMRPDDLELRLCQRYFETTYQEGDAPGTVTARGAIFCDQDGAVINMPEQRFQQRKFALPSITFYNPTDGLTGNVEHNLTGNFVLTPGTTVSADSLGRWTTVDTEPFTEMQLHWTAEAEL